MRIWINWSIENSYFLISQLDPVIGKGIKNIAETLDFVERSWIDYVKTLGMSNT